MGSLCCKRCYEVEEERKPLLEGDRSPVQHDDQAPDPVKDDDGTLHVVHENASEARQKLFSQFQSEVGDRIESSPSSQQLVVSVQDKSAVFSHSLPDSDPVMHSSSKVIAQVPASEDEPQNAAVSTKALPEPVHVNSTVNSNTLTPPLPDSSFTEVISTAVPIEDEQTELLLTRTGIDLEQKDSNSFSAKLVPTEDESEQQLGSEQPTGNTLQSLLFTEESSALSIPRDDNSEFGNSAAPIASTDHQRSSTKDAQTVSVVDTVNQTTTYTGDTQNDANASVLASEILAVEAENQSTTYAGDMQNDAEILVVEAENQTTTNTGDVQNDAEILVVEAENQTTTNTGDMQSDAEILVVEAENQTTTNTGDVQNDAEILVVEGENQTTTNTGDVQNDAEILVVEGENQTTSYTEDVQNDAEIPLLEAENEATAPSIDTRDKLSDTECSMIETEDKTTTTSDIGATKNDADISMFEIENTATSASAPGRSQSDAETSVVETGNHTTANSYTAATEKVFEFSSYDAKSEATTTTTYTQSNVETPVFQTGNQTSRTEETQNETDILMFDEAPTANTSGSSQGDAETSVVETGKQATATSHTGDQQKDAEISLFEAETKATAASTSGSSQSDVDTAIVETGKETTYYSVTQNVFEIDFSDHSTSSKRRDIESVPLLQRGETPEDYTDDATKDLAARGITISLKKRWYSNFRARNNHLNKPGSSLLREFDTLMARSTHEVQYTSAQHHLNSSKNRPGAPLPPDTSARVKLQPLDCAEGFDYINACYIGTPSHSRAYIVTQTPMGNTVGDFWRMVWEQGVSVIVLLTQKIEHLGGLSPKFWPKKGLTNHHGLVKSGNWIAGSLSVKTIKEVKHWNVKDLVTRHIELRTEDPGALRTVEIYHYLGWPQHDIARSPKDVVYLLNQVIEGREYLPEEEQAECPVVVVSAHGAGRAGCLCSVAVAHELMTARQENPDCWTQDGHILDEVIQGLRKCRGGLVEDRFQYEFCHHVLSEVLATSRIEPSPMKKRKGDTFEVKSKKKGQKQKGKHRMH